MTPGQLARSVLGERLFRTVGRQYRAVFVDLQKVVEVVACELPQGAHVLDVGGGDGEPLDRLLAAREDIRVTSIDISPTLGQWIGREHRHRVELRPQTTLQDYVAAGGAAPDVVLLTDVVHHVPLHLRPLLFEQVNALREGNPSLRLVVKDVEPGHWRARLGYLSDRYITGDTNVVPIGRDGTANLVASCCPGFRCREVPLFALDPPNYVLIFEPDEPRA